MKRPDIEKLKQLSNKATGGKWIISDNGVIAINEAENDIVATICDIWSGTKDAEFIAESRQAVPELIKYIEQLENKIDGLTKAKNQFYDDMVKYKQCYEKISNKLEGIDND